MARYRKIDVRMWGDEWFRGLSPIRPCGCGLWIYLLTGEDTGIIPGLFRAGELGLSEALGWSLEAFREAFREVSREGKTRADWKARVVWVPNAIRFNAPASPNVVRSWREAWDEIPECALKTEAHRALKAFVEGMGEGFAKAFAEACPEPSRKAMANQEQEQEQEQEHNAARAPAAAPLSPLPRWPNVVETTHPAVWSLWLTLRAKGMDLSIPKSREARDALEADVRRLGMEAAADECVRVNGDRDDIGNLAFFVDALRKATVPEAAAPAPEPVPFHLLPAVEIEN